MGWELSERHRLQLGRGLRTAHWGWVEIGADMTRRWGRASRQRAGGQSPIGWETSPGHLAAGRAGRGTVSPT